MTTATFTTDAQRLVALSIGKIAASRSQRGGINLHKNLLVASVLHKARTSYMMENYLAAKTVQYLEAQTLVQQPQCQEPVVCDEPVKYSTSHAVTPIRQESRMESGSMDEEDIHVVCPLREDNKENSRPAHFNESLEIFSPDNSLALCEKKMDTNSMESDATHRLEKGVADYVTQLCQKCTVKRRSSFDQENDSSCPKKAKLSNGHDSEKMEYTHQENSQINNLVNIFNSGMSDVCTNLTNSDYVSIDCEHSNKLAMFTVQTSASCQNRKSSMENYSCSVQVKDNLCDNLPTVIALTV